MEAELFDVAIIGAGGAGTMAYLRTVLNGDRSLFITGDAESKRKGRATWVFEVDNIPGMHDVKRPITATTKSTFEWLAKQDALEGIGMLYNGRAESIRKDGDNFVLSCSRKGDTTQFLARHVIVTTGIMDVQPEIEGSIKPFLPFANRGDLIYCIRCDGHQTIGSTLSMIGANDTTIYIAAMMMERYGHERVPILSNGLETGFSQEALRLAQAYEMQLMSAAIVQILGSPKTGLEGFELADGTQVKTNKAIVALGIIAYNELFSMLGAELAESGKAIVSEKYETSVAGLFVAGDLVAGPKMQIYTAWDEAVDAADEINRRLRLEKRRRVFVEKGLS